jgi:hypothetical protein
LKVEPHSSAFSRYSSKRIVAGFNSDRAQGLAHDALNGSTCREFEKNAPLFSGGGNRGGKSKAKLKTGKEKGDRFIIRRPKNIKLISWNHIL